MQKHFDAKSIEVNKVLLLDYIIRTYERLLFGLKIRTVNVLEAWRESFPNDQKFFQHFFSASSHEIMHLRNCGKTTVKEIINLRDNFLRSNNGDLIIEDDVELLVGPEKFTFPSNILKARTVNVLEAWRESFPNDQTFFQRFFSVSYNEIIRLRNCGKTTVKEIIAYRDKLLHSKNEVLTIENDVQQQDGTDKLSLPSNIDEVLPFFIETINGLSTRSRNCILWLLQECNHSISTFYDRICEPRCLLSLPSAGRKSIPEIENFFVLTIEFLKQFPDEESVFTKVKHYMIASPSALDLPKNAIEFLLEKEKSLGYFPIFAAIKLYLENRPEEDKFIINSCLLIYKDQQLPTLGEMAASINLTRERTRQKRNFLIKQLSEYYKTFRSLGFINKNPYRYQMTHIEDEINATEGTNFNLNFVSWVLGSIYDELTLIGEPVKSLGGYYHYEPFLCIVPTALSRLFDFEAFIDDMDNRMMKKRINEERICIKDIINTHLKIQYCEEEMPEIDTTCRTILYLHFAVEVDRIYVIFPPNAYKNNQIVIEEILRAAGRPMTLSELMEEYMFQYPERDANENSLRCAIIGNKNTVPIGRSSTYALVEWNQSEMRGGTIRSFVQEFIDSTPERIASTAAITEYVLRFRPETNEKNIVSNINLDPDKTIAFYFKDGKRYLGYADKPYPVEYFPLESYSTTASIASIYYPKFIKFVRTYYRFPFTVGYTEDESTLRSFWIRQESLYKKGILDSHALIYYERIVQDYGKYKIEKSDFEWRVQFVHAAQKYGLPLGEDAYLLDIKPKQDLETWLRKNLANYYYRQKYIAAWKIEKIASLIAKYLI
jgi:hypothetical protein